MTKNRAQRLGFGLLLLFYRIRGKFPTESAEIDSAAVEQIASQLGVPVSSDDGINTANRTEERHRAQIRTFFGFHEASVADAEMLTAWLSERERYEITTVLLRVRDWRAGKGGAAV